MEHSDLKLSCVTEHDNVKRSLDESSLVFLLGERRQKGPFSEGYALHIAQNPLCKTPF